MRSGTYKLYPVYRPSGVEWLEEIPAHWEVKRLKHLGELQAGAGFPDDEQGDLTQEYPFFKVGDMGRPANRHRMIEWQHTVSTDTARKLRAFTFPPSTIVFAKVGAALLLNRRRMLTSPSCIDNNMMGFIPQVPDPIWMMYWLSGLDLRKLANPGAVPSVNEGQIREQEAVLPPLPEQRAIAAFLDRETAKIDALVAKKERLIELLQEKRTALISRAVTRGLDPDAPMKDSGAEWLGEIPAHWDVKRLRLAANIQTGVALGKRYVTSDLITRPYLRVANVQDGYLALDDVAEIELPRKEAPRYELRANDVLLTEGGDFDKLGRGHVWSGQIPFALHQNHIFAVRPNQRMMRSGFLSILLASSYGRAFFTATSKQSTNLASTNSRQLSIFPIPMPSLDEQRSIISFLDHESEKLDVLIARVHEAIERLKELRGALISAAVTGRIDVREGAA